MCLVQNWPFFPLFFLGNIGQENVFYDILERKNAFLGSKLLEILFDDILGRENTFVDN